MHSTERISCSICKWLSFTVIIMTIIEKAVTLWVVFAPNRHSRNTLCILYDVIWTASNKQMSLYVN